MSHESGHHKDQEKQYLSKKQDESLEGPHDHQDASIPFRGSWRILKRHWHHWLSRRYKDFRYHDGQNKENYRS